MSNGMERNRQMVTALQNDPRPQALQRWHAKEKKEIFFFYFMFFLKFSSSSSSSKATTKATHYMTASSKTHRECTTQMLTSKPMYKESKCMWGCIT
jgi:hypothetical protein